MEYTVLKTFSLNLIIILTTFLCLLYGYYIYVHGYWKRKNVPYIPGTFPFGNIGSVILRRETFLDKIGQFYKEAKVKGHKYIGVYFFTRKALLAVDPALVKKVLTTDFQYFPDRGIYYDEKNDPLSAHLVALSGDRWRELRQKVTPTFSSGKLKTMYPIVLQCAQQLVDVMEKNGNSVMEMKDLAASYTTDVIGNCAFGIECNSLKNPDAEFRSMGRKMFQSNRMDIFKRLIIRNAPWLARKLKIKVINPDVSEFFLSVVKETIDYRLRANIARGDFLQLLIELMDKDIFTANEIVQRNKEKEEEEEETIDKAKEREDDERDNEIPKDAEATRCHRTTLTMHEAAAHAFVFFLAGFETSASTITFALYELARCGSIQDQVRREVYKISRKYRDGFTYESVMEMHYMEAVLLETMRKYPTFVILMRKCIRDYVLPDGNTILEKGTPVIIPVHALHHDPDYYQDPYIFNPDRFHTDLDSNQSRTADHTYLPFGNGPRICIGLRFAMIQMKVAIASLLLNFKFTLNEKTNVPLIYDPGSFVLSPLGGTWLNVTPLSQDERKNYMLEK